MLARVIKLCARIKVEAQSHFKRKKSSQNMTSYNFSEFTDEEIRDQLEYLGFKNVSQDKFSQFKKGEME